MRPAPLALMCLVLLASMVLSLGIERYPLGLADISEFLQASTGLRELPAERYAHLHNIIVEIRLPRVLLRCSRCCAFVSGLQSSFPTARE